MDLRLDVGKRNGWAVLTAEGEIDIATAPRLREQLIGMVNDGANQIVVDLSGVDFIDSTGLGVLIGALKRVRTNDGDLALVCSEPRVLKIFEITGLLNVFAVHPSVDAAAS